MLLEEITMEQFQKGLELTQSVIVPFGSVEEHGLHLPLGTDTIHVYELARLTAGLRPVFVTAPLWYGLCRSTKQHPGTVGISSETLKAVTKDMCVSLYDQGLRNFVLISGHAGGTHMASILDAADRLTETLQDSRFAVLSVLDLVAMLPEGKVDTPGDAHAGEVETSLMKHLRPEWVRGTSSREFPSFPRFIIARNKLKFWPGGVWGDPARASSEKGKEILELEAQMLSDIIEELENFQD